MPITAPAKQQIKPSHGKPNLDLESYIAKATKLIHTDPSRSTILQSLPGKDPVQKIADMAVVIMQRIDAMARQSGIEILDTVKMAAMNQIVRMLVEVAAAARYFVLSEDLITLAVAVTAQDYTNAEIGAKRIDRVKLFATVNEAVRASSPKDRKAIMLEQSRIPKIAKQYNFGKGLTSFKGSQLFTTKAPQQAQPQAPSVQPEQNGLINSAQ